MTSVAETKKARVKARRRLYYERTRDRHISRMRQYHEAHKVEARDRKRAKQYGMDAVAVAAMQGIQDNACAVCGRTFVDTPQIDHDHKTGHTRSLLCRGCNVGLGCFGDDPNLLREAALYLERWTR